MQALIRAIWLIAMTSVGGLVGAITTMCNPDPSVPCGFLSSCQLAPLVYLKNTYDGTLVTLNGLNSVTYHGDDPNQQIKCNQAPSPVPGPDPKWNCSFPAVGERVNPYYNYVASGGNYGSPFEPSQWRSKVASSLVAAGFNHIGIWSDMELARDASTPSSVVTYSVILDAGRYWMDMHPRDPPWPFPDPFASDFGTAVAHQCEERVTDSGEQNYATFAGFYSDNELAWESGESICNSFSMMFMTDDTGGCFESNSSDAYGGCHAMSELLYETYGGDFGQLLQAWDVKQMGHAFFDDHVLLHTEAPSSTPLERGPFKEAMLRLMRGLRSHLCPQLIPSTDTVNHAAQVAQVLASYHHTEALLRDLQIESEATSRAYFNICRMRCLPGLTTKHTVGFLGCRFHNAAGNYLPVIRGMREAYPRTSMYPDAVSVNIYNALPKQMWDNTWAELTFQTGCIPWIISEFSFRAQTPTNPSTIPVLQWVNVRATPGTSTKTDDYCRGMYANYYVQQWYKKCPFASGVQWFQFVDEPYEGRAPDSENSNWGMRNISDATYSEFLEQLASALWNTTLNRELAGNSGSAVTCGDMPFLPNTADCEVLPAWPTPLPDAPAIPVPKSPSSSPRSAALPAPKPRTVRSHAR